MVKRLTLITGIWPPNMRTTPIWRMTRKVSRMLLALNSLKLSAQSPPWSRKAFPMAAWPSFSSRFLASPANTIGGKEERVSRTWSNSFASGYSGSWSAFFVLQLSMFQLVAIADAVGLAQFRTTTDLLGGPKMQGLTLMVKRDDEDEARAILCFLLLHKTEHFDW